MLLLILCKLDRKNSFELKGMIMIEVFLIGFIIGLLFGLWIARRMLLSRMHHDDVEKAHADYSKRKEKYL